MSVLTFTHLQSSEEHLDHLQARIFELELRDKENEKHLMAAKREMSQLRIDKESLGQEIVSRSRRLVSHKATNRVHVGTVTAPCLQLGENSFFVFCCGGGGESRVLCLLVNDPGGWKLEFTINFCPTSNKTSVLHRCLIYEQVTLERSRGDFEALMEMERKQHKRREAELIQQLDEASRSAPSTPNPRPAHRELRRSNVLTPSSTRCFELEQQASETVVMSSPNLVWHFDTQNERYVTGICPKLLGVCAAVTGVCCLQVIVLTEQLRKAERFMGKQGDTTRPSLETSRVRYSCDPLTESAVVDDSMALELKRFGSGTPGKLQQAPLHWEMEQAELIVS